MDFNLDDLLEEMEAPQEFATGKSSRGNSVYGISITYNHNGKRLTITKALAEKLGIEGQVYIALHRRTRRLILAKELNRGTVYNYTSSSGKPVIYNSSLVEGIVYAFGIEDIYENGKTSLSFHDVNFSDDDNIAFVKIPEVNKIQ